jgi:hypothetical protein
VPAARAYNLFSCLFSFPVRQTPTNLSACVLRKNQLGADGQHWRLDLFSNLKQKETKF